METPSTLMDGFSKIYKAIESNHRNELSKMERELVCKEIERLRIQNTRLEEELRRERRKVQDAKIDIKGMAALALVFLIAFVCLLVKYPQTWE